MSNLSKIHANTMAINLVHFTNPSRFYFRNLADEDEEIKAVEELEANILSYIGKLSSSYLASLEFYQPKIGDVRKITNQNPVLFYANHHNIL